MPDLKKHRSFYYLVLIVSAYHFTLAYLFNLPQTQLRAYALGHVPYPFQGRIFMALVFRLSMGWQWLTNFVQHEHKAHISDPLQLVFAASVFVSLIVAAEFVRLGLKSLIGQNLVSTYAGLLVPYMCYFNFLLAPIYLGQLPYDLPGVAFYSIGLWSILRRKWWAFAIVFAVGTLNKETTCFLVLILLVVEGTRLYQKGKAASWWKLAISAVVLTAIWASLYHFSMHYFSAHPTLAEPYHWKSNLRALLVPWQWPQLPSTFGFLWLPFIFGFRWIRHQGLQLCAWLFVLWFLIMSVVGVLYEIRIYSEWIPYVAICIGLIVHHRMTGTPAESESGAERKIEALT